MPDVCSWLPDGQAAGREENFGPYHCTTPQVFISLRRIMEWKRKEKAMEAVNKGVFSRVTDKNDRWFAEKLGDFLLDMAKLVFGGVILAGIMESDVNLYWLFGIGGVITIWMIITGFIVLRLSHPKK